MMKRLQLFCTSLLLVGLFTLMGATKANATHVMGSDVTYRCISPGVFQVTVKMYRDCRGVSMSTITLQVRSSAGSVNVPMTRTAIGDVTPVCANVQNPCNPSNTYGTGKGIEEHTFVGTINFNNAPFNSTAWQNACEVTMGFGQCCRNGAITTGQANANFYAEAMMNKCKANCNNAPVLTNPPIAFVCCTQPFFFNNGATDTADYDSLSYKLVAPMSSQGVNISYGTSNLCGKPFSAAMPMTPFLLNPCGPHVPKPNLDPPQGFYLDPITGDIIFTPNECNEVGVVVIQVEEWRKDSNGTYQLIGRTRRDIQMWVETCPANNPPKVNGPYSYSVCPGDQLCFNITTKDDPVIPPPPATPPPPDTVSLSWNRGIPGASFTITNPTARLKTGQFCWTPGENQVSSLPYTFTATARDDACPINASATRGYSVLVKERAKADRTITPLICGEYELKSEPIKNYASITYDWTIRDSNDSDPPIFFSSNKIDSFRFTSGGKYIITHTVNYAGNCPSTYKDTIVVPPLLEVEFALEDTFLCEGFDLELKASVTNGKAPFSYEWTTGNPADTTDTYTIAIPQDTVLDTVVHILVTDDNGCTAFDSAIVFKKPVPRVDIGPDRRICDYDSINIGLIPDTFNTNFVPTPYTFSWNTGNPADTLDSITLSTAGTYILTMVDSLGCPGSDTMELFVNAHVAANAGPDITICAQDTAMAIGTGGDTYLWTDITNTIIVGTDDTAKRYLNTPVGQGVDQDWKLEVSVTEDTTTCYDTDTTHVRVNPLPVINLTRPVLTEQCYGEPDVNLNAFGTTPTGGDWYYHPDQSLVTGSTFKANEASGDPYKTVNLPITYVYTDNNGCVDSSSSLVRINELPPVVTKDTTYCDNAGIQQLRNHVLAPANPNIGNQEWRSLTSPNAVEATAGAPPYSFDPKKALKGLNNPNRIEYTFQNILTGCLDRDTAIIRVIPVPEVTLNNPPELCANEPQLNLSQLMNAQPTGGKWVCLNCNGFNPIGTDSVTFNPGARTTGYTYNLQYRHTATGCLTTGEVNLRVNRIPNITISAQDDNVCENEPQVILNATPSGAGGAWSGAGASGTLFIPSLAGVIKDANNKLVYSYKDPATGCQNKDSLEIYVQSRPAVSITADKTVICQGDVFNLTADAQNAPNGIQWSSADGDVINNMSPGPLNAIVTYDPSDDEELQGSVTLTVTTRDFNGNQCPEDSEDILLSILEIPDATIQPIDSGCEPHRTSVIVTLNNTNIGVNDVNYVWDFGDGTIKTNGANIEQHTWGDPGNYTVTVYVDNQGQCFDTASEDVDVWQKPNPNIIVIPADLTTTLAIPEFTFINNTSGGDKPYTNTWTWGDNSPPSVNPEDADSRVTHVYTIDDVLDTGNTYLVTLTVETAKGCKERAQVVVRINPDITIYVPNAFAPEPYVGKDVNNYFFPVGQGYTDGEFKVFNRWGEKLYETTFEKGDLSPESQSNPGGNTRYQQIGWDGTYANGVDAPTGVYVYVVKARSFSGEEYTYTGSFTLLR